MNRIESQHTEWKESWRDDLLRWVSGFANAEGGRLEIGRNNKNDVYEDRLKIWNHAVLPEGWTLENLLADHASTPFNPDIANAFFRAGEIETWGRGIQRIFEACENAGTPAPIIDYKPNDLWIEFPFSPEYLSTIQEQLPGKMSGNNPQKTTQKTTQKIIEILREHPAVGRRELANLLGGITENGVNYHLEKLKASGLIRRVGPDRGGHWVVTSELN